MRTVHVVERDGVHVPGVQRHVAGERHVVVVLVDELLIHVPSDEALPRGRTVGFGYPASVLEVVLLDGTEFGIDECHHHVLMLPGMDGDIEIVLDSAFRYGCEHELVRLRIAGQPVDGESDGCEVSSVQRTQIDLGIADGGGICEGFERTGPSIGVVPVVLGLDGDRGIGGRGEGFEIDLGVREVLGDMDRGFTDTCDGIDGGLHIRDLGDRTFGIQVESDLTDIVDDIVRDGVTIGCHVLDIHDLLEGYGHVTQERMEVQVLSHDLDEHVRKLSGNRFGSHDVACGERVRHVLSAGECDQGIASETVIRTH